VIALGDSFHDGEALARIGAEDRASLTALQRGRDWMWIAGNHDPRPPAGIGGGFAAMLALGGLAFRHVPETGEASEIAGHLHPTARVAVRGGAIARRCFVHDEHRVVMPAFGAYAGGLNVRRTAFARLLAPGFSALLLGEHRLYAMPGAHCLPD
jgi:DNA ligase-associated metallophosphoesterase